MVSVDFSEPANTSSDPIWPWFAKSNCPGCGAIPGSSHGNNGCAVLRKPQRTIMISAPSGQLGGFAEPLDLLNDPLWPASASARCPACGAAPGRPHQDPWCPVIRTPDEKAGRSYSG
jgi:hypothetical protein